MHEETQTNFDRQDHTHAELTSRTVVCFAGNDWWVHNPYTEKQWMLRLVGRGYRVLFVNSIGIGVPRLSTPKVPLRLVRKISSLLRFLWKSQGVWVFTPLLVPLWSIPFVERLNAALLTFQLRFLLRFLRMRRPVFWAGLPTAATLLDRFPHNGSVYYIQDNYLAYYDRMTFSSVAEHHASLLERCDAVICASVAMYDEVRAKRGNVHYIPHGVAKPFLEAELDRNEPPPETMQSIPHPIVGYWGSLEVLQDQALLARMAERHPEWSIVLIGQPMYDFSRLRKYPNIHFLGYLPIEEIPRYGAHFDVAVVSWVQNEWVRYSAPVKAREYYAMGKPVVAPVILEIARELPGARTAADIEEFIRAVEEELASDSPEKRRRRRSLVAHQSWDWSAGLVAGVLEGLVGHSTSERKNSGARAR
ncbi:MAG: glycosyltransferase [Bacteroidota bacterium]|nr:glycosyltransferase [Bacteroidota bacterium]